MDLLLLISILMVLQLGWTPSSLQTKILVDFSHLVPISISLKHNRFRFAILVDVMAYRQVFSWLWVFENVSRGLKNYRLPILSLFSVVYVCRLLLVASLLLSLNTVRFCFANYGRVFCLMYVISFAYVSVKTFSIVQYL